MEQLKDASENVTMRVYETNQRQDSLEILEKILAGTESLVEEMRKVEFPPESEGFFKTDIEDLEELIRKTKVALDYCLCIYFLVGCHGDKIVGFPVKTVVQIHFPEVIKFSVVWPVMKHSYSSQLVSVSCALLNKSVYVTHGYMVRR